MLVPNDRSCLWAILGLGNQHFLRGLRIWFEFGKKSYSCRDLVRDVTIEVIQINVLAEATRVSEGLPWWHSG